MRKPTDLQKILRICSVGAILVAALPLGACGKKKPPAGEVDVKGQVAEQPPVPATTVADADAAYLKRHTKEGTEEAIRLYEAALAAEPARADGAAIRVRLSVLYYGQGYWFHKDSPKTERMDDYWKGREHALAALRANAAFAKAVDEGQRIQDAAPLLTAAEAPAMFWCATDWGRWGELKGILRVALDIPKVKGLQQRLLEVAEDYYQAGAHRFFSAYYEAIPEFAGQDLAVSKAHCDRSLELAPGHPENHIICAQYYAVHVKDRALFERLLNEVLAMPLDEASPYYFEHLVAKEDAREMLGKVGELFDE